MVGGVPVCGLNIHNRIPSILQSHATTNSTHTIHNSTTLASTNSITKRTQCLPRHSTGKVALITGASKGIGKAAAIRLTQQGARIVATYGSDTAAAKELVEGMAGALAIQSNAGSVTEIHSLVIEVVKRCGKIDILVLNAGILPMRDLENNYRGGL
jgi:methylmalonyl-CoA mutase cobalamin-binding subunit